MVNPGPPEPSQPEGPAAERRPPAGARTMEDSDPERAATDLVSSLGAELAKGLAGSRAALARRREAAAAVEAAIGEPGVGREAVGRLRQLEAQLARAERIRIRTEVQFTERLSQKLSRGTGLAVHPEALYSAAQAVVDARRAADAADSALTRLGPAPDPSAIGPTPRTVEARDDLPNVYDEEALARNRDRIFAFGAVVAAIGLGILLAVFVMPVLFIVPVLIVVPGVILFMRRSRNARVEADDRRQAASSLAAAAATADHATASVAASREALDRWTTRQRELEGGSTTANERLRAAERAWEALAGPGADANAVEDVVRARNPQFQLTGTSAEASPTMRTVNAFHRRALARWRVLWATLGWDLPPPPEEVSEELDRLEAVAEARRLVEIPLVVVEPFEGADDEEQTALQAELAWLGEHVEVVIVQRAAADLEGSFDDLDDLGAALGPEPSA